jgi:ubiquinol-cytochrome c reductase cytochrome c subunit
MKNYPCSPIRTTVRLPRPLSRLTAATLFGALAFACAAAQAASADNGKAAFIRNGCWQCHGFVGQGGVTGPALAPNPKPLSFITVFVRNTNGAMPPYQKAILSEADLADIFAYLQSIPKGKEYQSIPLLNP